GVRTFVEVGPGKTLTRLVESILDGRPHHAVALDTSAGKRSGMLDLAHTLGRLAALGYPVRLTAWDENAPPAPATSGKPVLTVPICGANYRKPRAAGSAPGSEDSTRGFTPPPLSDAPVGDRVEPRVESSEPGARGRASSAAPSIRERIGTAPVPTPPPT